MTLPLFLFLPLPDHFLLPLLSSILDHFSFPFFLFSLLLFLPPSHLFVIVSLSSILHILPPDALLPLLHIPGRVARLVIINAPSWFHSVWSMVARVLPESVRQKITIMNGFKGYFTYVLFYFM